MEKLDLTVLLKDCPQGTKLYSTLHGEVEFKGISSDPCYPIDVLDFDGTRRTFTDDGKFLKDYPDAECQLFPSKECRDWSKIQAEYKEIAKALNNVVVDEIKKTLFEPFQKVLVRNSTTEMWRAQIYSLYHDSEYEGFYTHFCVSGYAYEYCIPYEGNEHLNGTTNEPNIKAE